MNNRLLPSTVWFLVFSLIFGASSLPAKETKLFRWEPEGNWDNFGDALSQPIVERILGRSVERASFYDRYKLLAVGSILQLARSRDTIWGSGLLNGTLNRHLSGVDIRAVRGPLTRSVLLSKGIPCPPVYGDPALLFGILFPEFVPDPKREYVVIPHFSEIHLFEGNPNLVSPREHWEVVVQKIVESRFVISSSLHGIIIAEAYGIPARMLLKGNGKEFFKYRDYYYGTGRRDFRYATSIEEALEMGGEEPPIIDLSKLLNSFPHDLWK